MGLPIRQGIQEISPNGIHSHNSTRKNHMTSNLTNKIIKNSNDFHQNRSRRNQNHIVIPKTYVENMGNNSKEVTLVCNSHIL